MGQVPTTINKSLGEVESVINEALMSGAAPVAIRLISAIPQLSWLNIWPISSIFSYIVNFVFQKMSVFFQVLGIRLVINIQTAEEQSVYLKAEGELRAAMLTGDPNAIAKAKQAANDAINSLVHYDGSSPIV